jgi:hypothetical protein
MNVAQIEALPDHLRLEAKRRLGLAPPAPEHQPALWSVQPFVSITDEPDTETDWSTT